MRKPRSDSDKGLEYKDFVLRLGPRPGGFAVEVVSPEGEGRGRFAIPPDFGAPETAETAPSADRFRDAIVPASGRFRARRVGTQLFQALFAGEVASLLYTSLRGVGEGQGLRIRIEVDPRRPELAPLQELPWELLCRPDTQNFLCLSRRTPVVRSLSAHHVHRPISSARLRILVWAANPANSRKLQLERELHNLECAWKRRDVEIVYLSGGREELRRAFLAAPFQVLHVMGHARFDQAAGCGIVLLEDAVGAVHMVGGRDLAEELQDFEELRLVVFNACETARAVGKRGPSPFTGVATAQVMSGVPVVVAMRESIPDAAAVTFSCVLYERLASGDPVEAAVTEGRLALRREQRFSDHWSTPILFLRGPDGRLFASAQEQEPGRSSPLRVAAVAALGGAALALVLDGVSRRT